ncbi:MAG: tRNA (adenosine(37)-N6)-threonylcarbamoyltransferase complex ATPase subunit type 1 TsaE, partial [Burkholderiaceae bacterium]
RIKSPTYAVVEPYSLLPDAGHERALDIWHFDFYRFNDAREWEDAGFRELFASPGLKIAEWPEKAAAVLPTADLDLRIQVQDDSVRQLHIAAGTQLGLQLLQALPP